MPKLDRISCKSATFLFNSEMNGTKRTKQFHHGCCSALHTFSSTFDIKRSQRLLTFEFLTNMVIMVRTHAIKMILTCRQVRVLKIFTILQEIRVSKFGVFSSGFIRIV